MHRSNKNSNLLCCSTPLEPRVVSDRFASLSVDYVPMHFPHVSSHTYACLVPHFPSVFRSPNAFLSICAIMPCASFALVRHVCIVCRCISIGPWKNVILLMDPKFSIFQILLYMYLYSFMCFAWSAEFRPICHDLDPWIMFLWLSWSVVSTFYVVAVFVIFVRFPLFSSCNKFSVL